MMRSSRSLGLVRIAGLLAPLLSALACSSAETGAREDAGAEAGPAEAGMPDAGSGSLPGFVEIGSYDGPGGYHLGDILPSGDLIYVANSWSGITTLRRAPGGALRVTQADTEDGIHRCTTIALHEPTRSIFCAAGEIPIISRFDISTPEAPAVSAAQGYPFTDRSFIRQLVVVGDNLFVTRFNAGLTVMPILAGGDLGPPTQIELLANVRFVAPLGDALIALTSDRGLMRLSLDPGGVSGAELPLDGPPLDLSLDGQRAAVALGSNGAQLIDLSGATPVVLHHVHPPGVVTAASADGDALALSTLTGVYLYDLRSGTARMAGFIPALATMLHARIVAGELIATDWIYVRRFSIDLDGEALALDTPRGRHIRRGEPAQWAIRNPGDVPLRATPRLAGTTLETVDVPPGQTVHLSLPGDLLLSSASLRGSDVLPISTYALAERDGTWLRVSATSGTIVLQTAGADPSLGRPAIGDPFPSVAFGVWDGSIYRFPEAGRRQRLSFFVIDCIAMWPVIEDNAWLARSGLLDEGAQPVLTSRGDTVSSSFATAFNLEGAISVFYEAMVPPLVLEENARFGTRLYEDGFEIRGIQGGAAHPTDYLVDESGAVIAIERVYRGAYPLR